MYEEVKVFVELYYIIIILHYSYLHYPIFGNLNWTTKKSIIWISIFKTEWYDIKDNELLPRNPWRKRVVHELVVGRNNQVRGAVSRPMSSGKASYIKRDVKRLIPFELEN